MLYCRSARGEEVCSTSCTRSPLPNACSTQVLRFSSRNWSTRGQEAFQASAANYHQCTQSPASHRDAWISCCTYMSAITPPPELSQGSYRSWWGKKQQERKGVPAGASCEHMRRGWITAPPVVGHVFSGRPRRALLAGRTARRTATASHLLKGRGTSDPYCIAPLPTPPAPAP